MEQSQKKSNKLLLGVTAILLVATVGMGGFIFANKDALMNKNTSTESKQSTNTEKTKDTTDTTDCPKTEISYELKNALNSDNNYYAFGADNEAIHIHVQNDEKSYEVLYNGFGVNKRYNLGWTTGDAWESLGTRSFDRKIVEVIIGGVGQDASGDTIYFLMEDGTVEYIPIVKELTGDNWRHGKQTFNSYGKVDGVEGVVSLVQANAGSHVTVLGKKADGSFYDLGK